MNDLNNRNPALDIDPDEFRKVGHALVDRIASFLGDMPNGKVTPGEDPSKIREILGDISIPNEGRDAHSIFEDIAPKLFEHSLFNGHPRFWGYITSSAAPIGALGDMLAATVNPNVGASRLSPMATEMESQVIKWLAEFIGYPTTCGGILVSGGNMANFVGFLTARTAMANWDIRKSGLKDHNMMAYVSKATHTWIEKAGDLFGLGTDAIRWIPTREDRMDTEALKELIEMDLQAGLTPFMVVGAAGTVGIGTVDPLLKIAEICVEYGLWFHADGAYGAPAAALPEASQDLKAISLADSVALDPHKWLYAPLEAGCTLVKDPTKLRETFSFIPEYYSFDSENENPPVNYYEYGLQNSRGFRALKVWLGIQHAGRDAYEKMIREDIALAAYLYEKVDMEPQFEALSHNLSITTFRYTPGSGLSEAYLNDLNKEICERIQSEGVVFVSNAVLEGKYALRACVVNFRSTKNDMDVLISEASRLGEEIHQQAG